MTEITAAAAEKDLLPRLGQAEAELLALRRQVEHLQGLALLGTLAAGVAHEINNVLTPVLAYAQLARSRPEDRDLTGKALDRAVAGVESAARIAEAVLGFAREGDDPAASDVVRTVEGTLACLARDPARDGVCVTTAIEPGLSVKMTPHALQQVLLNLVLNALGAMEETSGGSLTIRAARGQGKTARIEVADTGPGIRPDIAEKLFQPFVSGRSGRGGDVRPRRHPGGSGLGLAVSRRLIEAAGGTIGVTSSEGHGATFAIELDRC